MDSPRPIYALRKVLSASADEVVLVCEGEKCADRATDLGFVATCCAGGAMAASKADWTPLRGRRVVICPDADDPGARYAEDVSRLAHDAGAVDVKVIDLHDGWPDLPEGGDLADLVDSCDGDRGAMDDLRTRIVGLVEDSDSVPPPVSRLPESNCRQTGIVPAFRFDPKPITELGASAPVDWVWDGFAARGYITLLTALWKSGKTTLLSHLLRDLARGDGLVSKPADGPVLVVTEEPLGIWRRRRDELDLSDAVHIAELPTMGKPSLPVWLEIVEAVSDRTRSEGYSLVAFDTLPSLWPVVNENDAGEVGAALSPTRRITEAGAALLFMHHPRKGDGLEGTAARGSGALPSFVDVVAEMRRFDRTSKTDTRRVLTGIGRLEGIPPELVIQLGDDGYTIVGDRAEVKATDRTEVILSLLPSEGDGVTAKKMHEDWPASEQRPGLTTLRGELNSGALDGKWSRSGGGVKKNPWTYRKA